MGCEVAMPQLLCIIGRLRSMVWRCMVWQMFWRLRFMIPAVKKVSFETSVFSFFFGEFAIVMRCVTICYVCFFLSTVIYKLFKEDINVICMYTNCLPKPLRHWLQLRGGVRLNLTRLQEQKMFSCYLWNIDDALL